MFENLIGFLTIMKRCQDGEITDGIIDNNCGHVTEKYAFNNNRIK